MNCTWSFILDLENKLDTIGRPFDRRTILYDHVIEEHGFTLQFDEFCARILSYYIVTDP